MKKIKKTMSILLCVFMVMSAFTVCASARAKSYKAGDVIEYGTYPQSEVTDEALIEKLNSLHFHFQNYSYWHNGERVDADYSVYADVMLDGERYRAVEFSEYRHPFQFGSRDSEYRNKYKINTRYWFKFEPLKWIVVNPETGLVISQSIVDYQEYNNSGDQYAGYTHTEYESAVSYFHSSIRHWLIEDFYQSVFTRAQRENIKITEIDNSTMSMDGTPYPAKSSYDAVFLPSQWEADELIKILGDEKYNTQSSDYAHSQGLGENSGRIGWYFRTAFSVHDNYAYSFLTYGDVSCKEPVRPAMILSEIRNDSSGITASGRAGKEAFWSIDNEGVLSIGGCGQMAKMSFREDKYNLWTYYPNNCCDYKKYVKKAVVENGITTINGFAFEHMPLLTEVYLPATLESIDEEHVRPYGPGNFYGSENLEKIVVEPGENNRYFSVDGVLYGDFYHNGKISLICYPPSKAGDTYIAPDFVDRIHTLAFSSVKNLKTIIYPENVESSYYQPYARAYSIKDVYIYNRSFSAGDYIFGGGLENATVHSYRNSDIEDYYTIAKVNFQPFCEGIHYGGEASCTSRAVCLDCGEEYDSMLSHYDGDGDGKCDSCSGDMMKIGTFAERIAAFFAGIRRFLESLFR